MRETKLSICGEKQSQIIFNVKAANLHLLRTLILAHTFNYFLIYHIVILPYFYKIAKMACNPKNKITYNDLLRQRQQQSFEEHILQRLAGD